ncbi:MAG: hypothetical protein COA43_02985 [Robiginitomaculum sp.]|nr:MAG: hypothetical protein COA43_02985 [Robiginitomaculum sp.]
MSIETPQQRQHLGNIQALRGIAALLVVISHLYIIEQKYSPDTLLNSFASFGMVGVDLFFVISGFIMIHVAIGCKRGLGASTEFLFARITRIYPLYWLISLPLFVLYLWRPDMVFSSVSTAPNFLKSFLLYPDTRIPLLGVGWTLIHEMGFYIVFAFALVFKRKWLVPFMLIWFGALIIGQQLGYDKLGPVRAILFSPLSFEFIGGAVAGIFYHKYQGGFARTSLILAAILWILPIILLSLSVQGMTEVPYDRALYFTLPCALTVYGLASIKSKLPLYSQTLGDWSYALYLTHVLSLTVMGRIWHKFTQDGLIDNVLVLILMVVGSIFVAGCVHKLAEQPMLKITKRFRARLFAK